MNGQMFPTSNPHFGTSPIQSMEGSCKSTTDKEDSYSSNSSVAFLPHLSSASKMSSGRMAINTIGFMTLEEQVALLAKSVDSLTATVKE